MNSLVKIDNKEYLKVAIIPIVQYDKTFYVGKLDIEQLEKLARLRPVNYDEIKEKYEKENTIKSFISKLPFNEDNTLKAFNRPADLERAAKITKYFSTNNNAILPNTIIVGGAFKESFDDIDEINLKLPDEYKFPEDCKDKYWKETFNSMKGSYTYNNYVYIPYEENSLVIIDGQHRYLGLKGLKDKNNFDIPVTFLFGFKSDLMAETFYTVNFTQKTVDKSLLVHLKNTFLENMTLSKLIYEYIKFLNFDETSPLENRIKLLPDDKEEKKRLKKESIEEKRKFISLAYLQQELEILMLPQSKYSSRIPIYAELLKNEDQQYIVLTNFLNYLKAIKYILNNNFPDKNNWNNGLTVFTKAIGLVALIQVLPHLIIKILEDKNLSDDCNNIKNITIEDFIKEMSDINQTNLSAYEGAGSLGSLGKLKNEVLGILKLKDLDKKFVLNPDNSLDWISKNYIKKEN